jgi:capsule polysaccharide export protein KpsC/LpsZ
MSFWKRKIKVRFQTEEGCTHMTFENMAEASAYIKANEEKILAFQFEK